MRKVLIALVASLVLCVPAFADTDPSFASQLYYGFSSDTTSRYHLYSDSGVYFYAKLSGATTYIYAISETRGSIYYQSMLNIDTSEFATNSAFGDYFNNLVTYNADIYLGTPLSVFPSGASDADIQAAFAQYLASPVEPIGLTSVLVPRGNVLYFKAASDYVFGFEAEFSKYSALLGGGDVYGPWGDTYQRLSVESSLPVAGITFPRPNSIAISWEKGAPYNVLGQSKKGLFRTTVEADGTYIAFYNPAYQSVTGSDGDGSAEVGCNVWVTGDFDFIRIYPLQQLLDNSSSPDGYENYLNGTPDGDTVIWTDPNDNVSAPVSGGDNQEDEPISSVSLIEAIKRILRNILSEIENIFTFGFSAIRDLVDLMDEFVATFDDLYEWLPEECYTLLIACVSVAIVIGVFKVFL